MEFGDIRGLLEVEKSTLRVLDEDVVVYEYKPLIRMNIEDWSKTN